MKPVLYIESEEVDGGGDTFWDTAVSRYAEDLKNPVPLYTTPQTKPLSDEEIEQLREYHGINEWMYETSVVDFARAIEAKVRREK